jgi:hypothetical protein
LVRQATHVLSKHFIELEAILTRTVLTPADTDTGVEATRTRLNRLAWLLDNSIPIPGLRFRIGIDALIGLFPFVGDALGVLLSAYIVSEAARLGAPRSVLARMALNVAVEGVVGLIPFVGDLFDAAWKANQRNVQLLNAYMERPRKTVAASRALVAGLIVLLAAFMIVTGLLAFALMSWLAGLMTG